MSKKLSRSILSRVSGVEPSEIGAPIPFLKQEAFQKKVGMSMVVVPRVGITAIMSGDKNIPTNKSS
jgi:hypothetical protein